MATYVSKRTGIPFGGAGSRVQGDPVAFKPVQECGDRDPRRIDGGPAFRLGD
jgi:hypothetical protein